MTNMSSAATTTDTPAMANTRITSPMAAASRALDDGDDVQQDHASAAQSTASRYVWQVAVVLQ